MHHKRQAIMRVYEGKNCESFCKCENALLNITYIVEKLNRVRVNIRKDKRNISDSDSFCAYEITCSRICKTYRIKKLVKENAPIGKTKT